jgi:pimeloyl-ACP methyl ester carboxylesterase
MHEAVNLSLILLLTAALALLVLVVITGYSGRMKAEQLRMASFHPKMEQTAHGPIEYEIRGEGPVVLISHGITGGVDQCFGLASTYLMQEKLQILAVSRFGYGRSSMPEAASPAEQADAFQALLYALGIKNVHVVGNSAGAAAAIQFAIRHSKQCLSLLLVSSNFPNDAVVPPKLIMKMIFGSNFVYWATISLFGRGMLGMAGIPPKLLTEMEKSERKRIVNDILFSGLPIRAKTKGILNDLYLSNVDMNKGYDLSKIESPVLIVHAKDDPARNYTFAERTCALIPNCKLIAVESGGHLLLGSEKIVREASYEMILSDTS